MSTAAWDVAVVGAGVLGAFHAYFARRRGLRVLLLERGDLPGEASVRNFGMVAASAMPPGDWHRRGLESAAVYRELARELPLPLSEGGTQYLATTPAECAVLEEFARLMPARGYRCRLLDAREGASLNPAVNPDVCRASLHFPDDLRLAPRGLFAALVPWLAGAGGCDYRPRAVVVGVREEGEVCRLTTAAGDEYRARHVFICSGADLRTLFPAEYAAAGLVSCKLQMLRLAPAAPVPLPTSLASGLTLRRYLSFRSCPSWARLADEPADPELGRRGIHVLLVRDPDGRLVLGDSHQYSAGDLDATLDTRTEELILAEAGRLLRLPPCRVAERWHGVYSLHPEREVFEQTVGGRIHLITGIGGKGMTVGPALARESVARLG
jgi:FAD dependent oxidoreductase TIGR03364